MAARPTALHYRRAVGSPVWLTHWKPSDAIDADEAHSLSRRLYVYLVLIAASLTLLFSLASVVYRLLTVLLGAPATASLARRPGP